MINGSRLTELFKKLSATDQDDFLEYAEIKCANNLHHDLAFRAKHPAEWEELRHLVGKTPKWQPPAACATTAVIFAPARVMPVPLTYCKGVAVTPSLLVLVSAFERSD